MRPNLVIILSDQHNPHVGGYAGNPIVRTPNLDELARGGVLFDSAYCAAPVCGPSRMAFLTSQSPTDLGIWTNDALLDPYQPTFAHQLTRAGYQAVLCGRMHFEDLDQRHGFQRRFVGDVNGARDMSRHLFEDRLPIHVTDQDYRSVLSSGPGRTSYMSYDDEVTARAQRFIEAWKGNAATENFCLTIGYLLPHNPYVCPRDLFEEYMDQVEFPWYSEDALQHEHPALRQLRGARGVGRIGREDSRRALAAYYGLVTYVDACIGRVLEALSDASLRDRTVIAYLSDHGEMAGEHNLWWKECFYEGSVKVPMIWSWPGHFPASRVVSEPASLLDVGPTLIDIAGAEALPAARGRSLLPQLRGEEIDPEQRPVYSELFPQHPVPLNPGCMIRMGRWKLNAYFGFDRPQLFDLAEDPHEVSDLGSTTEHATTIDQLMARVRETWSGEEVIRRAKIRTLQREVIRDWHERVVVGETEVWTPPANSNWLDDAGDA